MIDWGAEEIIKTATNKLGIDKEKSAVLGYYIVKFSAEGLFGKITDLFKLVDVLVKAGTKGTEAINELKRMGIVLDMPKDKDDAARIAVTSEANESTPIKK